MDRYILNTVDYDYKALNHEGFGGVCKYAAAQFNIDFRKSFAVGNELRDLCICSYEPVTGILLSEDNDPVGESGDSIICLNDLYSACRFISEHG